MIALDAGVLIAHLDPAHVHHAAASGILLAGTSGQLFVHTLTLVEVLVGGVRIGRGAAMHHDLLAAGIVVAPPDGGEALRLAELRAASGLKLPECCVLDVAMRTHATLATFNDALAAVARRRGLTVHP